MVQDPSTVLPSDYLGWLRGLAADRRFGSGDRRGTVNLIDEAARERARAAIGRARPVSLARTLRPGPARRQDGKPGFALEVFYTDGPVAMGSDHVELDCHGRENTHIDGLNHIGLDGTWYGGHACDDPAAPSILEFGSGLVTRAVHADIGAVRDTPWVHPAEPVSGADLDAAVTAAGLTVAPGDALLIDMGRDRYEAAGQEPSPDRMPGVGADGARWILDHKVAIVCWDFLDAVHPDEPLAPVHLLNWAVGLVLVDNCDFSRLRAALPPGQAAGALVLAPLPIDRGTGSNLNPIVLL